MKPLTDLEGSEDLQEADEREDHESPGPQLSFRELVASVHEPPVGHPLDQTHE